MTATLGSPVMLAIPSPISRMRPTSCPETPGVKLSRLRFRTSAISVALMLSSVISYTKPFRNNPDKAACSRSFISVRSRSHPHCRPRQ